MKKTRTLMMSTPTDREVVLTRIFNAPRQLVFEAWTNPRYLARWWGQPGSTLRVCEVDLRPGGLWRFAQSGTDGNEYAFHGEYREVVRPERLVYTFTFDAEDWRERAVLVRLTFEDQKGKTKFTQIILHKTAEDRDKYLRAGMERGAAASYDKLAEHLATQLGSGLDLADSGPGPLTSRHEKVSQS